ncbi:MAG: DUF4886 domain-containing protein [Ruminococcaceae bacterium]|nr:DUF4886 domain-containing protein [Oscillospiraceae bacterium]
MKKAIRIFLFAAVTLLVITAFVSCKSEKTPENSASTANIQTEAEYDFFENESVEILFKDGKFVIKGSFDNSGSQSDEFVVNYTIVKNGTSNKPIEMSKAFAMQDGTNSFELSCGVVSKDQTVKVSVSDKNGEVICEQVEKNIKSLRLLSVGNSFSVDAQQWLYGIAKDMGYDNIILGNLYMGGCSLYGHYNSYSNNAEGYIYYKNTTGTWEETHDVSMLHGLTDESWDYITLQQASGSSGVSDTYKSHLPLLVQFVKENAKNGAVEILWHMTWAYSSDSTHQDFVKYDNDQMKMYESIVNAVEENVVDSSDISFILPSGTAIQNARATELGDTLCRDGFHLELGYGRYLAGLTWIHKITGQPIDDVTYIPDGLFDEETLEILKKCAKDAVNNPFEVTI